MTAESSPIEEALFLLGLLNLAGVGERAVVEIVEKLRERDTPLALLDDIDPADLVAWDLLSEAQAQEFHSETQRDWRVSTGEMLDTSDITCLPITSPAYPAHLRQSAFGPPPPVLLARGAVGLLDLPGIAFAGARDVSAEGERAVRHLAAAAVQHRFPVVSGGARGADAAAHETAVAEGGATVVVLAEGLLTRRALALAEQVAGQPVAIASPFLPEQSWQQWAAMQRNRTILGLSDRLVVVEARERGGTIAAGREALRHGMATWVLDFGSTDERVRGNALLLEAGGRPIPVAADGTVDIPPDLFAIGEWLVAPLN